MDEDMRAVPEDQKIYDLLDVVEEKNETAPGDYKIYDLVDVVEEKIEAVPLADNLEDEIAGIVTKIAERIAREMFPSIAEKIIREEIEQLKKAPGR